MYIMYIVVHTDAAAALCILVVGTEIFDMNQPKDYIYCMYMYSSNTHMDVYVHYGTLSFGSPVAF